jgi:hypothetical protein
MLQRMALAACVLAALGAAHAQEIDERQAQAACQDDAFRLCSATIPDRERTLACLIYYKDSLSTACRTVLASVIPPDPPPAKKKKKASPKPKQANGPVDLSPTAKR